MAATRAEALRVMRALQIVYADQPRITGEAGDPELITNYCVAPGVSGYGIIWNHGPAGWAERFPALRDLLLEDMDRADPRYIQVDTEGYASVFYGTDVLVVR